jgi:hypothetical protein
MQEIRKTLNIRGKKYLSISDELQEKLSTLSKPESVYAAYVASRLYPDSIDTFNLITQVREVFNLPTNSARGADGNIFNALKWKKPPMIYKIIKGNFVWNEYYNTEKTEEIIRNVLINFIEESKIPNDSTLDFMRIRRQK